MSGVAEGREILIAVSNPRKPQSARDFLEARLDGAETVHRRQQHRPDRAEADHAERHRARKAEDRDRHRDDRGGGQGPQEFEARGDGGAHARRGADQGAERDSDDRGDEPAAEHVLDRAGKFFAEVRGRQAMPQRRKSAVGGGQEHGRNEFQRRDLPPAEDRGGDDGEARQAPGEGLPGRRIHGGPAMRAAWPKRRFCAKTSAALSAKPTTPIHTR